MGHSERWGYQTTVALESQTWFGCVREATSAEGRIGFRRGSEIEKGPLGSMSYATATMSTIDSDHFLEFAFISAHNKDCGGGLSLS